ncbi:MAG: BspA family leucine-rich repeat surface protein [Clostridia bacterium]|nr:BspA family leucine-rich repeat surface protein [Clostridia bacterium]
MKKPVKKKRIPTVCIVIAIILLLTIASVTIFAKYSITWEKGFGIKITPKVQESILTGGTTLNGKINDETKHIIFGNSNTYKNEVNGLEAENVGADVKKPVYLYYDALTYTTYILSSNTIKFNADSSGAFKDLLSLESIAFENYTTEIVTDMSSMFEGCPLLTELNLTEFDTSAVTDTASMFKGCEGLATIYASNKFNTGSVISSDNMFTGCYNLVGGEGTRVYPSGETETTQPLDKSYARIDVLGGAEGYFTGIAGGLHYFVSNILKEQYSGASYTVSGSETYFTVSNGLDSSTYSIEDIKYRVELYVDKDADGVFETLISTVNYTLEGGQRSVQRTDITPLTDGYGVTHHRIKAVATKLTGDIEILEAEFNLSSVSHNVAYSYSDGILYVTLNTNDQSGVFRFEWVNGIGPDNSDPNLIFTDAVAGPSSLETPVSLNQNTKYDFIFFVNSPELRLQLSTDIENANAIVTVSKP